MKLEKIPISNLFHDPANARKHPQRNLDAIKASLNKFGQERPILVDEKNIVLAGNGLLQAARELGWESLYCVRSTLIGLDAAAFAIVDNRTSELAEWDFEFLAATLEKLPEQLRTNIGFSTEELNAFMNMTGWETPESTTDSTFAEALPVNLSMKVKATVAARFFNLFDCHESKADENSEALTRLLDTYEASARPESDKNG